MNKSAACIGICQRLAIGLSFAFSVASVAQAARAEPVILSKPAPASAILEVSMTRASAHELMRPRSIFQAPPAVAQFKLGLAKAATFVCYPQGVVKNDIPDVRCDAYAGDFSQVPAKTDALKLTQLDDSAVLVELNNQKQLVQLAQQVPQEVRLDGMQIILKLTSLL